MHHDDALSTGEGESLGAKKLYLPPIISQKDPVYRLPYYGAPESEIASLSDEAVAKVLRLYAGLVRKFDSAEVLRERLLRATRANYLRGQLTMEGVVVSNKMNKSVVIASRRRAYASKLRLKYYRTRRFMAHDELDLCHEGDRVVIRSCRPLSKQKAFVVVENYGDPRRLGDETRADQVAAAIVVDEKESDEAKGTNVASGAAAEDKKDSVEPNETR